MVENTMNVLLVLQVTSWQQTENVSLIVDKVFMETPIPKIVTYAQPIVMNAQKPVSMELVQHNVFFVMMAYSWPPIMNV